jgi:hypothetical protein
MRLKPGLIGAGLLALSTTFAVPAVAIPFDVFAAANSSTGGSGANTISLAAGQSYSVSVNPSDLWNAGALPRWSNADGLIVNLFATGTDDSGFSAGTQIGAVFPLHTQGTLTAPFGALVGSIGGGAFFLIGTSFSSIAPTAGILQLFYWDENAGDNTEHITAQVTTAEVGTTPLPAALPLFAAGLGVLGYAARRRKRRTLAV